MTVDDRQRARERAADAIATRDEVRAGKGSWSPLTVSRLSATQRKRRDRERARTGAAVASREVAPLHPGPPGVASLDGTAGTTAEPHLRGAHVDDRVEPLAGGTPGPAVRSTG